MISEEFDDIYFSKEDGLAETRHTFLGGNGLPDAWRDVARFCICETGFGTGLNMLAAWALFEETAKPHQRLDLISIEKFPLDAARIRAALAPWADVLGPYLEKLLAVYPIRVRGFHRLDLSPRVSLTLIFDDVLRALPMVDACVDAWFLDGFAPAKNPDMWQASMYAAMARLSHAGTTLATFTAAGDVRRGLADAGFIVEKRKGYGRKRDMVVGRFGGETKKREHSVPAHVAVVGAGIAGLSAAWHLKRAGLRVTVYETAGDIATQASGNRRGIINPKLTAQPSAQSDYYTGAYAYTLRFLKTFNADVDFGVAGGLHLETDADKARRFAGYIANLGWGQDHMRLLDADAASTVAGVPLACPCLYYPDAAWVHPRALCQALAQGVDIVTGHAIADLQSIPADAVVVANAADVTGFFDLPVSRVRGQVSMIKPNRMSGALRANLSYGGYITPVMADGLHMCGATFQPWSDMPDVSDADHAQNIRMLEEAVPSLAGGFEAFGGRVGFRASSKDRIPIVGFHKNVFLSVAHGSHGIISGLMAGAIAAASLTGGPMPLGRGALEAVAPVRFA